MADSCRRLTFTANVLPSSRHFTQEVPSLWSMWLKQDFCVEFFVVANTSSWNLLHNWLLLPMTASASSGFPPLTSRDTISDIFRGTRRQKTQYGCHQTVVVRTMRPLGCDNGKWYRGRGYSKLIKNRQGPKRELKMTGSPGQTQPLMWINKKSSWEKICKLIFFQIPIGIWWH